MRDTILLPLVAMSTVAVISTLIFFISDNRKYKYEVLDSEVWVTCKHRTSSFGNTVFSDCENGTNYNNPKKFKIVVGETK